MHEENVTGSDTQATDAAGRKGKHGRSAGAPENPAAKPGTGTEAPDAKTEAHPKDRTEKQTGALIYMGPNLLEGLFHGDTFLEMPKHFDGLFGKLPELKELFIDCKQLPQFKLDMADAGTEAHRLCLSVAVQVKEGALKDGV